MWHLKVYCKYQEISFKVNTHTFSQFLTAHVLTGVEMSSFLVSLDAFPKQIVQSRDFIATQQFAANRSYRIVILSPSVKSRCYRDQNSWKISHFISAIYLAYCTNIDLQVWVSVLVIRLYCNYISIGETMWLENQW